MDELQGIMEMQNESKLFESAMNDALNEKCHKLGVKVSFDWELDCITMILSDKKGEVIADIKFDNTEFQNAVSKVMPPTLEEMKNEPETTKEEEQAIEEARLECINNPTKKSINELFKQ